jgi:hypothetical protein
MTSKSEKFRELLAKERYLQSQLSDCETAQFRMLKKAFKNLGLKLGNFGDVALDQSYIKVLDSADCVVRYCRCTDSGFYTCEISFDDLFDPEVQE